jgi:hypothetical protein
MRSMLCARCADFSSNVTNIAPRDSAACAVAHGGVENDQFFMRS